MSPPGLGKRRARHKITTTGVAADPAMHSTSNAETISSDIATHYRAARHLVKSPSPPTGGIIALALNPF
jgi:hypothetical protein